MEPNTLNPKNLSKEEIIITKLISVITAYKVANKWPDDNPEKADILESLDKLSDDIMKIYVKENPHIYGSNTKKIEKSIDVRIMEIVKEFDYLIKVGEQLTIEELKNRAESVPGIMDEPDLQYVSQCALKSDISRVTRNSMGYWYSFKSLAGMLDSSKQDQALEKFNALFEDKQKQP